MIAGQRSVNGLRARVVMLVDRKIITSHNNELQGMKKSGY